MNFIKEILKGIIIGIANIIPGVSGGTMAVSMGVYDKIILAITGLKKDLKKSILTLLPYVIGVLVGIGMFSFIVKISLDNYPLQTSGLFVGLVIGGVPIIVKNVQGKKRNFFHILLFILFLIIVVGMAFLNGNESSATDITVNVWNMIQLFFVGIIAAGTMIIPGVSGSLVLMILGFYNAIVSNISEFIHALIEFDIPALLHGFGIFIPLGLGILVGIGLVAKLIEILFAKFPVYTYYAILGLIVGSPIAIIYKAGITSFDFLSIILTVITFVVGFAISYYLGDDKKTES